MSSRDEADRAFDAFLNEGRPEDLARVFDLTAPRLLLLAGHLAGRAADAEDVVQATFVRAIEIAPDRFERGRPVLPWLCGILANEARKLRRADARRPDPGRLEGVDPEAPDDVAAFEEMRAEVEQAVRELPEGYAQVLNLRLVHGLGPTEIAHALGMSPETVKTRIRRGTERLRAKLPAGFAVLLACLTGTGRSLSLVREAVVAAAGGAGTVAAVSVTTTVGAATAKGAVAKAAAAVLLVAAGAYGTYELTRDDGGAPVPEPLQRTVVRADERDDGPDRVPVVVPPSRGDREDEPPDDPPLYASIEGRFRDARGLLEGVQVALFRLHTDALLTPWQRLPAQLQAPPLLVGETATDAGGRFVFERVPPGGVWLLQVAAPGRPRFVELVAARTALDERVDLGVRQLPAVLSTDGRIIDPLSRPISGATLRRAPVVWGAPDELGVVGELLAEWNLAARRDRVVLAVVRPGGMCVVEPPAWLAQLAAAIDSEPVATDARGRFHWRASHDFRDRLLIEAPGFEPKVVDVTLSRDGAEHEDVVLERWDTVEIKVVDAAGAAVVAAEVAVGPGAGGAGVSTLVRQGPTGLDGSVRVDARDGAALLVAVRRSAGDPWYVERVDGGLARTVRLPARFRAQFRFADRAGASVEGAEVRLVPGALDGAGAGTLALHQLGAVGALDVSLERPDRDVVSVAEVPAGDWIALVAAPGFVPRAVPLRISGPVSERIELARAEPVRIEVLDSGFKPMRGLAIAAAGASGAPHVLPTIVGRTRKDAAVEFLRDRWSETQVAVADPGRGAAQVAIARGAVDGQLVARGTGGAAGAMGRPRDGTIATRFILHAERAGTVVVPEPPVFGTIGMDGTVRIEELPPGRWQVSVRPVPGPLIAAGSVLELLWPAEEGGTVVPLQGGPGTPASIRFDPVPVQVRAGSVTDFRVAPVPVVPEQEESDEDPRMLRGRLTIGGEPSSLAELVLVRGGQETWVATDADGRFDAGEQRPGDVEFAVRIREFDGPTEVWRAGFRIEENPAPLEIDVPTAAFGAMLTTAAGARADGARVTLEGTAATSPPGRVALQLTASPGGLVAFDFVPGGSYTLRVMDARHGWLERERVAFGNPRVTTGMSIRLEPLLHVTGRAGDVGVDVPPTSEVVLERDEPDGVALRRVGVFGARSAFTVDGLLPGRYRARLNAAIALPAASGGVVMVPPSRSGVSVDLADVVVPGRDLRGVVLVLRR